MQTQRGHEAISDRVSGPERRRSRKESSRAKRKSSSKESKKLQRDPERRRAYSFSPGRNDTIQVLQDADRPPVPPLPVNSQGKGRAYTVKGRTYTEKPEIDSVERPQRASTQPPETKQEWQRVPTLHKRSAQDLPRRKSSKKRKADHDREAEIKAMVPLMPIRPATDAFTAGRPMKKDIQKVRDGSNISLPSAHSIHSSLSGHDEQNSFRVSALEALVPRPTIRYAENPRGYSYSKSRSEKRKVSDRVALPEEILRANKRVHDLADDLNAGELRELMERDKNRREKKKIADKIKLEMKLAKRQQQQQEEEAAAVRNGTQPPANMERGVFGRDVIEVGAASGTSAVVTSSKRKGSMTSPYDRSKRPTEVFREESTQSNNPTSNFQRTASLQTENMTPGTERQDPIIGIAQQGTVGKASISPPASPTMSAHRRGTSSISQMMNPVKTDEPTPASKPSKATQPIPIPARKGQENNKGLSGSWTSFFKRNPKPKLVTTTSSFSNTSRDSMQNGQGLSMSYTPMRMPSSLPKRTMSKFREDLPELPMSPPDSRLQSPEADVVPPIREYPDKKTGHQALEDQQGRDTPMSGLRSLEMARLRGETPTSGHRSVEAPSPEPTAALSQSLASVDSEGSWLSGRRGSKRESAQLPSHPLHESASSLDKRYKEFSESSEELGIAEDEYFSRLTPGPDDQFKIQRQSATMPSSDDEEGGSIRSPGTESTKWGSVTRKATVVHREPRAKSREGLLNDFETASSSDLPGETPDEIQRSSYGFNEDAAEDTGVRRATSIDLGKGHVRQISAGSARLLDLKRGSGEKRDSL
jgi:hypothetical protein